MTTKGDAIRIASSMLLAATPTNASAPGPAGKGSSYGKEVIRGGQRRQGDHVQAARKDHDRSRQGKHAPRHRCHIPS